MKKTSISDISTRKLIIGAGMITMLLLFLLFLVFRAKPGLNKDNAAGDTAVSQSTESQEDIPDAENVGADDTPSVDTAGADEAETLQEADVDITQIGKKKAYITDDKYIVNDASSSHPDVAVISCAGFGSKATVSSWDTSKIWFSPDWEYTYMDVQYLSHDIQFSYAVSSVERILQEFEDSNRDNSYLYNLKIENEKSFKKAGQKWTYRKLTHDDGEDEYYTVQYIVAAERSSHCCFSGEINFSSTSSDIQNLDDKAVLKEVVSQVTFYDGNYSKIKAAKPTATHYISNTSGSTVLKIKLPKDASTEDNWKWDSWRRDSVSLANGYAESFSYGFSEYFGEAEYESLKSDQISNMQENDRYSNVVSHEKKTAQVGDYEVKYLSATCTYSDYEGAKADYYMWTDVNGALVTCDCTISLEHADEAPDAQGIIKQAFSVVTVAESKKVSTEDTAVAGTDTDDSGNMEVTGTGAYDFDNMEASITNCYKGTSQTGASVYFVRNGDGTYCGYMYALNTESKTNVLYYVGTAQKEGDSVTITDEADGQQDTFSVTDNGDGSVTVVTQDDETLTLTSADRSDFMDTLKHNVELLERLKALF